MSGSNGMSPYISEYLEKKQLAKLGYRFEVNDLTQTDAHAFNVIASELSKLESEQIKKSGKR